MITKPLQITIFVKDLNEAKKFYTEKLGFVVRDETEFQPGWNYLTVAPQEDNETVIELVKADTSENEALVGKQYAGIAAIMLATDDIDRDYREMKAKGVVFPNGTPKDVPGGKGCPFEDLYGNMLDMYQKNQTFEKRIMTENEKTVEKYIKGFTDSDHAEILSCLTEDIVWEVPGMFYITGKKAFDQEIENDAFVGNPTITIKRMIEENNIVVAEGKVQSRKKEGDLLNAIFCDVFHMKNGKIKQLTSYLMEKSS